MDIRQFTLPAGIGLTHIRVYDEPGPDGFPSGGAHIHLVCAEIYYVLKGTGKMEILSSTGLETIEIGPLKAVFFRPGTFHRVLNPNRDLEILSIMQNGGLPERGDFVMSFPNEILNSPKAYAKALRAHNREEALRRRDLSLQGFLELKAAFGRSLDQGQTALRSFYRAAQALIAPKVDGFEWVLKVGAQAEVKNSLDACDFIKSGNIGYLEQHIGGKHKTAESIGHGILSPLDEPTIQGMCGELHPYALDESFLPEGRKVA